MTCLGVLALIRLCFCGLCHSGDTWWFMCLCFFGFDCLFWFDDGLGFRFEMCLCVDVDCLYLIWVFTLFCFGFGYFLYFGVQAASTTWVFCVALVVWILFWLLYFGGFVILDGLYTLFFGVVNFLTAHCCFSFIVDCLFTNMFVCF